MWFFCRKHVFGFLAFTILLLTTVLDIVSRNSYQNFRKQSNQRTLIHKKKQVYHTHNYIALLTPKIPTFVRNRINNNRCLEPRPVSICKWFTQGFKCTPHFAIDTRELLWHTLPLFITRNSGFAWIREKIIDQKSRRIDYLVKLLNWISF